MDAFLKLNSRQNEGNSSALILIAFISIAASSLTARHDTARNMMLVGRLFLATLALLHTTTRGWQMVTLVCVYVSVFPLTNILESYVICFFRESEAFKWPKPASLTHSFYTWDRSCVAAGHGRESATLSPGLGGQGFAGGHDTPPMQPHLPYGRRRVHWQRVPGEFLFPLSALFIEILLDRMIHYWGGLYEVWERW